MPRSDALQMLTVTSTTDDPVTDPAGAITYTVNNNDYTVVTYPLGGYVLGSHRDVFQDVQCTIPAMEEIARLSYIKKDTTFLAVATDGGKVAPGIHTACQQHGYSQAVVCRAGSIVAGTVTNNVCKLGASRYIRLHGSDTHNGSPKERALLALGLRALEQGIANIVSEGGTQPPGAVIADATETLVERGLIMQDPPVLHFFQTTNHTLKEVADWAESYPVWCYQTEGQTIRGRIAGDVVFLGGMTVRSCSAGFSRDLPGEHRTDGPWTDLNDGVDTAYARLMVLTATGATMTTEEYMMPLDGTGTAPQSKHHDELWKCHLNNDLKPNMAAGTDSGGVTVVMSNNVPQAFSGEAEAGDVVACVIPGPARITPTIAIGGVGCFPNESIQNAIYAPHKIARVAGATGNIIATEQIPMGGQLGIDNVSVLWPRAGMESWNAQALPLNWLDTYATRASALLAAFGIELRDYAMEWLAEGGCVVGDIVIYGNEAYACRINNSKAAYGKGYRLRKGGKSTPDHSFKLCSSASVARSRKAHSTVLCHCDGARRATLEWKTSKNTVTVTRYRDYDCGLHLTELLKAAGAAGMQVTFAEKPNYLCYGHGWLTTQGNKLGGTCPL